MRSAGVAGIANIAPFFLAAQRRRVDIIGIFDSNGSQNGITGHFEGQAMAAATMFGAYGSAFIPGNPPTVLTVQQAGHIGSAIASATAVDANFTAIQFPSTSAASGGTGAFGLFDWCNTFSNSANPGSYCRLAPNFPVDMNGKIGYCPVLWRPQTGGVTQLKPGVSGGSYGVGPGTAQITNTTLALSAVPSDGISEEKWVIARGSLIDLTNATNPANSAANYKGVGLRFSPSYWTGGGTGVDGTNVGGIIGHRITDEEMFHGIAYSPFYVLGGFPTRAVALDLCGITGTGGMTDAALGAYLKGLSKAQRNSAGTQLDPMLLVQMIEGGNDAGDTTTIGSSGLTSGASLLSTTGAYQSCSQPANAGNTATGYYNNTVTVLRRIKYVWTTVLGYNASNLFFLIGCYHPQSSGISSAQWTFVRTTMVTAMATVITDMTAEGINVCSVDGYKLGNYAEFGRVTGNTTGGAQYTDYVSNTNGIPYNSTTTATADKGTWANATAYIVGDQVTYSNVRYLCIVAHTSATADDRPSTGTTYLTKWTTLTGAQAWYRDPSNQDAHLNQQGYLAWGIRVWGAIRAALSEAGSPGYNGFGNRYSWHSGGGL